MADGIEKHKIQNLNVSIKNAFIIGLIINKSDMKIFDSHHNGGKRGVITFTVRDSKRYFINCVVWGSDTFIESHALEFHIGQVINIIQPKITLKFGDKSELYNPLTTSQFILTINEGKGYIINYNGEGIEEFSKLLRLSIRSTCTVYNLIDVNANGNSLKGQFIDLLVIVRSLKPIRKLQIKNSTSNNEKQHREIILMDKTFAGMCLKIWNNDIIERSNNWTAMATILHLIDVRSDYSQFYNRIVIEMTTRTIIIENPDTIESKNLLEFAILSPAATNDMNVVLYNLTESLTDIQSISKVMTVQQIYDRANSNGSLEDDQFTALVFAVITKFDLDGISQIFSRRCTRCKQSININDENCGNEDCIVFQIDTTNISSSDYSPIKTFDSKFIDMFDIKVNLTDHTGTLVNCCLVNRFAEKILNYTWKTFLLLNSTQRCEIKWKYLLERCTIKLVVKPKSVYRSKLFVTIIDCSPALPVEVKKKIKVY